MTLLSPDYLWLLIPLLMLFWVQKNDLVHKVHLIILILLVLSLTRPVQEKSLQDAPILAKDIIIAMDVSYSMNAQDIQPSRYRFATQTISALLQQSPSDNIMLIAFTTNPLLLSPPTTDHALINIALQSLNPEYILTKGTSLSKLFKKLKDMHVEHKNLILITDGGEENNLEALTDLLHQTQLSIHILALGTTQGTTVKDQTGSVLKNKEGNLVISRINPLLEDLAHHVQGTYHTPSSTPEATAIDLHDALQEASHTIEKKQYHYREFYQLPLLLATILFLMLHTRAVKYLVIMFTLLGLEAQASMFDTYHLHTAYNDYIKQDYNTSRNHLKKIEYDSLQSRLLLANTYYKQGYYENALKVYRSIRSRSKAVKQTLYYNIANTYVKMQKYNEAKTYYAKALQLGFDEDAQHNLRIVALLKERGDDTLGIAHPKSQNTDASKSENQEEGNDKERSEDQPSSGSGGGGEAKSKEEKKPKEEEGKLLSSDEEEEKHPLSSKTYELINKGYIRETKPW